VETRSRQAAPRSLAESLRSWDDADLADLLQARVDLLRPTPKDLAALAARATSGPSTSRCLDGLSRLDLHLLNTLVQMAGQEPVSAANLLRTAQASVQQPSSPIPGLAEALQESLVRVCSLALVWGPNDNLRATHAVRDALAGPSVAQWPVPQLVIGPPAQGCDAEGGWQGLGCLSRVRTLLDEWGLRPPSVLRTGGLGVREFAAARAVMHADPPVAALAIELAAAAGLLASDEEATPCFVPTDVFDDWLQERPGQAWARLAEAWLGLARLPSLADERSNLLNADQDRRAVAGMRRQVLQAHAQAPEHCPVSAASIEAVLDDRQPRGSGPLRTQVIRATLQEGTMLGVLAAGALTSAGRTLVANPGRHGAQMDAAMPPPVDHVLVQADQTIIAPGPLPWQLARDLEQIADLESTGHANVYRLSAASLGRAMEAGLDGPAVLQRLTSLARTPLPQTVTSLIEDVARRHGGVRVGVAQSYVRCADPVLATTIAQDRSLQRLGLHRVDEHLLIAGVQPSALLAALRSAGYPVAGETPQGEVLLPSQQVRRAPEPPRLSTVRRPSSGSIQAAVRALRSAESAQSDPGRYRGQSDDSSLLAGMRVDARLRCSGAPAVALLRAAITDASSVLMSYADTEAGTVDRLLDPIRIGGGTLTAFDHQAGQVRTFALARMASVAPVAADSIDANSVDSAPGGRR